MFNFPQESKQALQSPLIGVSFCVRLWRDFLRLSQMESFLAGYFPTWEANKSFFFITSRD